MGDWLEEAVYCWLQEAQEEAPCQQSGAAGVDEHEHKEQLHGYYSDDLTWMTLTPPMKIPRKVGIGREAGAEPPGKHKQRGKQNAALRTKATLITEERGLACDMVLHSEQFFAYGILEVTHDVTSLVTPALFTMYPYRGNLN